MGWPHTTAAWPDRKGMTGTRSGLSPRMRAAILSALKHHRIDTAEVSTDGDYVVELIKLFKQR